ncbi:hypothetical protein SAMN06266787_1147 [Halorubrum ezzemoulense]|uniref:DUF8165 domain-containing protein n=1 Tax=Halorubrum ezzemoulense TaxID=337243 RepID=A0A238YM95_HALEZ|nr:hypothetical protein [Halorubrum ezzemoulense]SNR71559.1 hypothetical protein SAMN06266787_1147 [Halorubrum ezzemoulense]
MSNRHFYSAGASVEYGTAACLFPVDELDATVLQHRDAQLALDAVDGDTVIVVSPTSLATGYKLGGHPVTAIRIGSLPADITATLDAAVEDDIETFDLIQIGKWNHNSPNHSLAEFTDA